MDVDSISTFLLDWAEHCLPWTVNCMISWPLVLYFTGEILVILTPETPSEKHGTLPSALYHNRNVPGVSDDANGWCLRCVFFIHDNDQQQCTYSDQSKCLFLIAWQWNIDLINWSIIGNKLSMLSSLFWLLFMTLPGINSLLSVQIVSSIRFVLIQK